MSYCTQCGSPQAEGQGFCTACGAAHAPSSGAQTGKGFGPVQSVQPDGAPYAPPVASTGHGLRTLLIVAASALLVVLGLGIAGVWYVGHKLKDKAEAVIHPYTAQPSSGSADATPATSGNGRAPLSEGNLAASSFPKWTSGANASANPDGAAPLKQGMLVVTAVADDQGDYESMKQVTRVGPSGTMLSYHADLPRGQNASQKQADVDRIVQAPDLLSAHAYNEHFGIGDPQSFPGSTAISASREVLAELKTNGRTNFSFRPVGAKGGVASLVGGLAGMAGMSTSDLGSDALTKMSQESCPLERASDGLVAFPVLLNEERTVLPALHARCSTDDGAADFYILDQAAYPLMLSYKLGSGSRLQVIKITYPPQIREKGASPDKLEKDLQDKKKVDIYGIYFNFASDRLRPESSQVLQEIARVMKTHLDWKLSVSGHTDNIGGDAYNLDLSKRRTAAVKQVLVTDYNIAPERLSTDGYGASRPVDSNDTLEGRARNRRVELVRN